jgi:hypothetical protein
MYLHNGAAQPFDILQGHFMAVIEKNKKTTKKNEWKLVPVAIIWPISYQNQCISITARRSPSIFRRDIS